MFFWNKNRIKKEGKCGICGEDYSVPKLWERGGRNYLGKSVRTYNQGQTIDVYVQVCKLILINEFWLLLNKYYFYYLLLS